MYAYITKPLFISKSFKSSKNHNFIKNLQKLHQRSIDDKNNDESRNSVRWFLLSVVGKQLDHAKSDQNGSKVNVPGNSISAINLSLTNLCSTLAASTITEQNDYDLLGLTTDWTRTWTCLLNQIGHIVRDLIFKCIYSTV